MPRQLTEQDVYDIASEVCEKMLSNFISNLVRLVPAAQDTVEEIQDEYFDEIREMREQKRNGSRSNVRHNQPAQSSSWDRLYNHKKTNYEGELDESVDAIGVEEQFENDIAELRPGYKGKDKQELDEALSDEFMSSIPLENGGITECVSGENEVYQGLSK